MPTYTTTTTIEALPPSLDSTLQMGGARQRIRLMRSTMKLGRSGSVVARAGSPSGADTYSRSNSPAPSMSSMHTTTTRVEALPIGPKRNVAQGVTHRRSGSGSGSGSESSQLNQRRNGSVFTGIHLTLIDDYSADSDDLMTYVDSKRGHKHSGSSSSSSTINATPFVLPPTKSFAAGRRSKESVHSPRPKPLALDENKSQARAQSPSKVQSKRQSRRLSTSDSIPEPPSKSHSPVPTPLTPSFRFIAPTIPEMRKLKLAKLSKQLGEYVPPELVFKPSDLNAQGKVDTAANATATGNDGATQKVASTKDVKSRRRSSSVGGIRSASGTPSRSGTLRSLVPKARPGASKWEAPTSWLRGPPEPGSDDQDEEMADAYRQDAFSQDLKEPWMGGWNTDDHDDIMKKLRAL